MGFIPTSRFLYLNHIKLVSSIHPYFGASVFALIVSNFNIGLTNGKVLYCIKVLYKSNYPLNLVIFFNRYCIITWILYLADLNLEACNFLSFHLIITLKQNVNFSFNIYSLIKNCCISGNVGRTETNLVTSTDIYFSTGTLFRNKEKEWHAQVAFQKCHKNQFL